MSNFFNIPKSTMIKGVEWVSERMPYPDPDIKGDTYPMTWADDGEICTSAGDPLLCIPEYAALTQSPIQLG